MIPILQMRILSLRDVIYLKEINRGINLESNFVSKAVKMPYATL